jgi:hypothetical protein
MALGVHLRPRVGVRRERRVEGHPLALEERLLRLDLRERVARRCELVGRRGRVAFELVRARRDRIELTFQRRDVRRRRLELTDARGGALAAPLGRARARAAASSSS